jgi:hypothetical protein
MKVGVFERHFPLRFKNVNGEKTETEEDRIYFKTTDTLACDFISAFEHFYLFASPIVKLSVRSRQKKGYRTILCNPVIS